MVANQRADLGLVLQRSRGGATASGRLPVVGCCSKHETALSVRMVRLVPVLLGKLGNNVHRGVGKAACGSR